MPLECEHWKVGIMFYPSLVPAKGWESCRHLVICEQQGWDELFLGISSTEVWSR